MTSPLRPPQHLALIAREYPGIWQHVDTMRQQRGLGLPHWPAWCFLPLAGAVAVITRGIPDPAPALLVGPQVGIVGALAAWRVTQGIYRIDPDVFEALWSTPLAGELPTALLYHLPDALAQLQTLLQRGRAAHGAAVPSARVVRVCGVSHAARHPRGAASPLWLVRPSGMGRQHA